MRVIKIDGKVPKQGLSWMFYLNHDEVMTLKHFPHHSPSLMDSHHKGSVMQTFGIFFYANLNKLWNKQSICWWIDAQHWLIAYADSHKRNIKIHMTGPLWGGIDLLHNNASSSGEQLNNIY